MRFCRVIFHGLPSKAKCWQKITWFPRPFAADCLDLWRNFQVKFKSKSQKIVYPCVAVISRQQHQDFRGMCSIVGTHSQAYLVVFWAPAYVMNRQQTPARRRLFMFNPPADQLRVGVGLSTQHARCDSRCYKVHNDSLMSQPANVYMLDTWTA